MPPGEVLMLDPKALDIARRLIREEIDERKENLRWEVEKIKNEKTIQGLGRSGAIVEEIYKLYAREVEIRTQLVFQKLIEVLSDARVQPSDRLAEELRQEVLGHQNLMMSGLKESLEKEASLIPLSAPSLGNARNRAISKIYARCDQFALSLRRRAETTRLKNEEPDSSKAIPNPKSSVGNKPPTAFLSHSTQDKRVARRLAHDLRAAGIDVWYAEWELRPGDSLRRKIDEGVEQASFFLVLLTPTSLKSEWVQTELDAGMVKRIEGSCKLIPIILNISDDQIPPTLKGIVWFRLEPYEEGLRKLIGVCHKVDIKPPLGSPPSWAQQRPLDQTGLTIHAQLLAALLNERSKNGMILDPILDSNEVLRVLDLTEDEIAIVADELEELGLAQLHKHLGMGKAGFGKISPTPRLFFETDPYLKGWNAEADARALAAAILNTGKETLSLIEADKILSWGPRRINPAAQYLESYGLANPLKSLGSDPYVYSALIITPRTRRFAAEG